MQPKAILFDLDGTLVDSIPLWLDANVRTLESLGVSVTPDDFLKDLYHAGLHYQGILEHFGITPEQGKNFYENRNDLFDHLLHKNIQWLGKAEETLKQCAAKVPLGMQTGAKMDFIDAMDAKLNLSSFFSAIVTADDTMQKMKPDPYGLLLLTKSLNVTPKDCIYVGDQGIDVQAAKNAGMPFYLLKRTETPEGAEKDATVVIEKIEDLVKILGY